MRNPFIAGICMRPMRQPDRCAARTISNYREHSITCALDTHTLCRCCSWLLARILLCIDKWVHTIVCVCCVTIIYRFNTANSRSNEMKKKCIATLALFGVFRAHFDVSLFAMRKPYHGQYFTNFLRQKCCQLPKTSINSFAWLSLVVLYLFINIEKEIQFQKTQPIQFATNMLLFTIFD